MSDQKTIPLIQLKPLESETLWHLAQGASVKEAAKTLGITHHQIDYILAHLRRRFFARTNPQLLFLFAIIVKADVRKSVEDAARQARENGATVNQQQQH